MASKFDTIIIGAGAAGLMCAAAAGQRGRRVLLLDHAKKIGEKIRISGGGRCNFTNIDTSANNFQSRNPYFAISALSRYEPTDFIDLLMRHGIGWHEKAKGQLFCDDSASQIVDMLLAEARAADVVIMSGSEIRSVERVQKGFSVQLANRNFEAESLVVACGGKSIPKIGATGFGFDIAQQFGLNVVETAAALVPLTFSNDDLSRFKSLAGVAVPVRVSCNGISFDEDMLFTHKGLSGPAILQISTFWRPGDHIKLHIVPEVDFRSVFEAEKQSSGRRAIQTILAMYLPKRLAQDIAERFGFQGNIADMSSAVLDDLLLHIENWSIVPAGSEGYRTAEVTRGGVDTDGLNAKTMEAKSVPGLFFIGEVVDVTGWLGGYNFQWAWASGHAAGQVV